MENTLLYIFHECHSNHWLENISLSLSCMKHKKQSNFLLRKRMTHLGNNSNSFGAPAGKLSLFISDSTKNKGYHKVYTSCQIVQIFVKFYQFTDFINFLFSRRIAQNHQNIWFSLFLSVNLLVGDLEEVLQQNLDTEEKVNTYPILDFLKT